MIVLDLLDVKITCWGGICHRARLRDHYVLYENVVNFKNKHLSTIICSDWNDMVEGQKNNYINKNLYNFQSFLICFEAFKTPASKPLNGGIYEGCNSQGHIQAPARRILPAYVDIDTANPTNIITRMKTRNRKKSPSK